MRRKKLAAGDVYAVPLPSGGFGFGVYCDRDFAFMALKAEEPIIPELLLESPLAFRVYVAVDAPRSGEWRQIGRIALTGPYAQPASYLNKPVGSDQLYIFSAGERREATREECRGLELSATWFSFHVEERLDDYLAGRENRYLRAMKEQLELD